MEKILFEIKDNKATIIINYPEKMNCLDLEMLGQLKHILTELESNQKARVIVIKGAGDKAFSTGGNLKDFGCLKDFHDVKNWIVFGNEVFNLLEKIPVPTFAAIQGYAMGGGLELALACDLRIATEDSIFSMPELNHGWIPGWGGLTRLRRLLGEAKAKELIMLGEKISGHDAHKIGLVNKLCSPERFTPLIDDTSNALAKLDPFIFEMSKKAIMDASRTTADNDLLYDALATYYSKI